MLDLGVNKLNQKSQQLEHSVTPRVGAPHRLYQPYVRNVQNNARRFSTPKQSVRVPAVFRNLKTSRPSIPTHSHMLKQADSINIPSLMMNAKKQISEVNEGFDFSFNREQA